MAKHVSIRVRALTAGFYGTRRRSGAEFTVTGEEDPKTGKPISFSSAWMLPIEDTPSAGDTPLDPEKLNGDAIKEELKRLGVDFPPKSRVDELRDMLKAALQVQEGDGESDGDGEGEDDAKTEDLT